jgi:hypothetical protein
MKRIVLVCFALGLSGLNSFGQTNNAVPPAGRPVSRSVEQGQKAPAEPKAAVVSAPPYQGPLSPSSEAPPADRATIRRMQQEGLLLPQKSKKDVGAIFVEMFQPNNDQVGETRIRDTVVTIYPAGL